MTGEAMKVDLKYLCEDRDRHGNVRLYVRRGKGSPKIRLRSAYGTPEFMAEYDAAVRGVAIHKPLQKAPAAPAAPGTLRWLVEQYYGSAEFKNDLGESTRAVRRALLDRLCKETVSKDNATMIGTLPFAMPTQKVRALRDRRSDAPEGANGLMKALRHMYGWAVEARHMQTNPAKEVPFIRTASAGFHTWTVEEVRQFEERHPIGSQARLAMSLMLFLGVRRSDAVLLGRQHLREAKNMQPELRAKWGGRWISFTEYKNRQRKPKNLTLPVLPELEEVIAASDCGDLAFLITTFGRPFEVAGFGNKFRHWCNQAGLPHCSAHGLRKAGATMAAERGATVNQLKAIFGWTTLKQAALYTNAAEQASLAGDAMGLLGHDRTENKSVPLSGGVKKSGTIRGKKA